MFYTVVSQLLTLSSIFTRDIAPRKGQSTNETSIAGQIFVLVLSLAGLALAYKPPATVLQIATQTFTGLAVLFPTVILSRANSLQLLLTVRFYSVRTRCGYRKRALGVSHSMTKISDEVIAKVRAN